MASPIAFNPFRCRMWALHDRLEDYITEKTCAAEIDSISKQGQLVPALGRRIPSDPDYDVELIYGARRLFVARHLNVPLLVELRAMSDAEALAAMHTENRERKDISPYERGLSYSHWLRCGQFASQEEIAKALNISPSQVSRLLRIAKLPALVVGAFRSPLDICEAWGLDLIEAWENPELRRNLTYKARALAAQSQHMPARVVYRALMSSLTPGRKLVRANRDEVVKSVAGVPLFRIRHNHRAVVLVLPTQSASATNLERIRSALADILETSGSLRIAHASAMDHGSERQREFELANSN
ncbi:MAG: ParB/RepB/Spo0J family partition protein [Steroidobacteraceae bacterium]